MQPTPPPSRFDGPPAPLTEEELQIAYLRQRLDAQIDETAKTWTALQQVGRQKVEADLRVEALEVEVSQLRAELAKTRDVSKVHPG